MEILSYRVSAAIFKEKSIISLKLLKNAPLCAIIPVMQILVPINFSKNYSLRKEDV